ncbi:hypothetical protein KLP28_01425 [Nocardioidaceae bacterium]|nr:hypothetical protein KLP28_01425 [Nocardioidaceae bacterium]
MSVPASQAATLPPPATISQAVTAAPVTAPVTARTARVKPVRVSRNGTTFRAVAPTTDPPAVSLATYAVADLDTGRILAARGANVRRQPASTIKLLTSLTAARQVAPRPRHRVTYAEAHPEFCICVGLSVGRRYSRDALMSAMLLPSANDAAEAMAGSDRRGRTAFLGSMNALAGELGLTRTRAMNPSGLTAYGASSTARDLLVLLRAAQADPVVAPFLGMGSALFGPLRNETRTIYRGNAYIDRFRIAEGKTGYTSAAGYNLVVAHPVRDADGDVRRIGVAALGAPSRDANSRSVAALIRWVADHHDVLRPVGTLPAAPGPVVSAQARWVATAP